MSAFRNLILVIVAILLMGVTNHSASASDSQDARAAWASVAASYNFNLESATPGGTFEDNYHGSDLGSDFAGAIGDTADIMGTAYPPLDPDDIMEASLTNWPDA